MPVYSSTFAGTHCAYPRRDGQAEQTWMVVLHEGGLLAPRWWLLGPA